MSMVSAAVLVEDAKKVPVTEMSLVLTPSFNLAFAMKVCAIPGIGDPPVTWETPPTYWYTNAQSVDGEYATAWLDAASGVLPAGFALDPETGVTEQDVLDAFAGARVWIGNDVGDFLLWADANLAPLGLARIPEPPL